MVSNNNFILISAASDVDGFWRVVNAGSNYIFVVGNERYIPEGMVFQSTSNGKGGWTLNHVDVNDHQRITSICTDGAGVLYHATSGAYPYVYRSGNYGATWDNVGAVQLLTSGPVLDIKCIGAYVWVGGTSVSYVSVNSGASYSAISDLPTGVTLFHYLGSGVLLAFTSTKIYKSTNYGASGSWSLLYTVATGHTIEDFCSIDTLIWFVGTTRTIVDTRVEGRIFKTTDSGASFDSGTVLYGSGAQGVNVTSLVYDQTNETVLAGTSGVYDRQWDGTEWNYVLISPSRVYESLDSGVTWGLVSELQVVSQITSMCLDGNGTLLVCGFGDNAVATMVVRHDQPLYLSPTNIIASGGKFDSSTKFPFKVTTGESYLHPSGQTIFLSNRGFRYNLGAVSYDINTTLTTTAIYEKIKVVT